MVALLKQRWNAVLKQSRSQLTAVAAKSPSAAQFAFNVHYTEDLMLTTNSAQQVAKLAGASVDRMAVNASLYEKNTGVTALSSLTQATASCVAALRKPVAKIERESGAMVSRIVDNDVVKTGVKRTSAFSQKRVTEAA